MGERREHIIFNHTTKFHPDLSSEGIDMGSIPRYPLLSHTLLHIKNYLFIVGIGPIFDNELIFIFRYVPFFVRSIEDRYKYYRINIRYTSVFDFFTISFIYNACYVSVHTQKYFLFCWYRSCFVYKTTQCWLHQSKHSCLNYLPRTEQPINNGEQPIVASNIRILL